MIILNLNLNLALLWNINKRIFIFYIVKYIYIYKLSNFLSLYYLNIKYINYLFKINLNKLV